MPKPGQLGYFSKVKEAREVLKERAREILDNYLATIQDARLAGDFETASKGFQWLMEHMPEEEGSRMVDISIDKPKQVEGSKAGPIVQIGFKLGGMEPAIEAQVVRKELPNGEEEEE